MLEIKYLKKKSEKLVRCVSRHEATIVVRDRGSTAEELRVSAVPWSAVQWSHTGGQTDRS